MSSSMTSSSAAERRYSDLAVAEALCRPYDYPKACDELSLILRKAYSKLPKPLQSTIFHDTLSAFRRLALPDVQTSRGISSANALVQAAEASLPRQKKSVAVSEFRRAMVAHKRNGKAREYREYQGSVQLPQDVLVHIFGFLDLRSLVVASSVCWVWNSASRDNTLWRLQYSLLFGDYDSNSQGPTRSVVIKGKDGINMHKSRGGEDGTTGLDWKVAFKRKYTGTYTSGLASHRAKCEHCKSIFWTSHMTSVGSHHCCKLNDQKRKIKPVSPDKIVEYLLGETDLASSDSDSDSDWDGYSLVAQQLSRLWAYPKLTAITKHHSF